MDIREKVKLNGLTAIASLCTLAKSAEAVPSCAKQLSCLASEGYPPSLLRRRIKEFPVTPGVYLMKDKDGRVIYVGKASNIRKRVLSYFKKPQSSYKNEALISNILDIDIIQTSSEHEALLLESRLIKQLKPYYNISLKDDKSFPYIKITKESFPRVFVGRKKLDENVEYIGPYTDVKLLRLALKSLRKVFPFCTCRNFPKRECLYYRLDLCLAPCTDKVCKKEYRDMISHLKHFANKGSRSLIDSLEKKMQAYSKNNDFEEALKIRDKIKALGLLVEQSKSDSWDILGFKKAPRCIEAFDISNLFGKEAVGSMATFINGKPDKNQYRRFKIKMIQGIDDYAMISEIMQRRYYRVIKDNFVKPDLIVIDGGKGHLNVALKQLKILGLNIPIIAIAKEEELIYTIENDKPLKLDRDSHVLQLVQRVRDEAHRFAINYHRLLRNKKALV